MSWGNNLLTNPSAETQDMTGWTSDGVSTEEKMTNSSYEDVYIDTVETHMDNPKAYFGLDGATGEYAFIFASDSDAYMYQVIFASDFGGSEKIRFACRFNLKVTQNDWDNSVLGLAKMKVAYDDGTFDYFVIPLVKGIQTSNRFDSTDFWILVENDCELDTDKTLDYVEVRAVADNCENNLLIDYFEIREEV